MLTTTSTVKNLGTIRVTQRTAVGQDDGAATTMLLVSYDHTNDTGDLIVDRIVPENGPDIRYAQVLGKVAVVHPFCMAGTLEEVLRDFALRTRAYAVDCGAIELNDYGTMFWVA